MTRVRVLTPAGRGAIAVVEVTGEDAAERVDRWFAPAIGPPISQRPINRLAFGRWRIARDGEPVDDPPGEELIAVRTAEDRVEVHCHGGVAASRAIVQSLVGEGAVESASDEPATIEQAARAALAKTPSERTASVLLDQLNGALREAIERVNDAIEASETESAITQLNALLRRESLGAHLVEPWRVVIAGPPNVGKSCLINALVGYDRAIVYDRPGTTRDVVTAATVIDGWPVTLADTAGVRETDDPLEAAGVGLALQTLARADVVIRVSEAAEYDRAVTERERLIESLPESSALIDVASKADLAPDAPTPAGVLRLASPAGEGIPELLAAIGAAFGVGDPTRGEAVPFTPAQFVALQKTLAALEQGDATGAREALTALLAGAKG